MAFAALVLCLLLRAASASFPMQPPLQQSSVHHPLQQPLPQQPLPQPPPQYQGGRPPVGPPGPAAPFGQPSPQFTPPAAPIGNPGNPQAPATAVFNRVESIMGRNNRHPRQTAAFAKYFPAPPRCECKYDENPLDLGRAKKPRPPPTPLPTSPKQPPTGSALPSSSPPVAHLPVPPQRSQGSFPPQPQHPVSSVFPVPQVPSQTGFSNSFTFIRPVERVETVYDQQYAYDATVGHAYGHAFHTHSHEWDEAEADVCPKQVNAQLKLSDGNRNFIFTSKNPKCGNMTWGRALDFCQAAGMQAVSLGDDKADEDVKVILDTLLDKQNGMGAFWTSGILSRTSDGGVSVMWASTLSARTEEVTPGLEPWATDGLGGGGPQPDNFAGSGNSENNEECVVAALNARAAYGPNPPGGQHQHVIDDPGLHDELCDKQMPVVCEERNADAMAEYSLFL